MVSTRTGNYIVPLRIRNMEKQHENNTKSNGTDFEPLYECKCDWHGDDGDEGGGVMSEVVVVMVVVLLVVTSKVMIISESKSI